MNFNLLPYQFKPLLKIRFWGSLLLAVYIFIFLIPPGLVPHSEHDHLGLLDSISENDPCHIAIYHPGAHGACHHKYHISKAFPDCPFCHVTLVRQIIPDPIVAIDITHFTEFCEIYFPQGTVVYFPILHNDRGPPASFIS